MRFTDWERLRAKPRHTKVQPERRTLLGLLRRRAVQPESAGPPVDFSMLGIRPNVSPN